MTPTSKQYLKLAPSNVVDARTETFYLNDIGGTYDQAQVKYHLTDDGDTKEEKVELEARDTKGLTALYLTATRKEFSEKESSPRRVERELIGKIDDAHVLEAMKTLPDYILKVIQD